MSFTQYFRHSNKRCRVRFSGETVSVDVEVYGEGQATGRRVWRQAATLTPRERLATGGPVQVVLGVDAVALRRGGLPLDALTAASVEHARKHEVEAARKRAEKKAAADDAERGRRIVRSGLTPRDTRPVPVESLANGGPGDPQ